MKLLLVRALNRKQILILRELGEKDFENQTKAIASICGKFSLPESTVRWNYTRLRGLGLVSGGSLTDLGKLVVRLFDGRRDVGGSTGACGAPGLGSNPSADPTAKVKRRGKV